MPTRRINPAGSNTKPTSDDSRALSRSYGPMRAAFVVLALENATPAEPLHQFELTLPPPLAPSRTRKGVQRAR